MLEDCIRSVACGFFEALVPTSMVKMWVGSRKTVLLFPPTTANCMYVLNLKTFQSDYNASLGLIVFICMKV